jgi:hypothetical protein
VWRARCAALPVNLRRDLQMKKLSASRPSAAMVVAVVALSFAMVGSAIAAGDGVSSKITKSKVKKISKKQADKELKANISGSHVNTADTATTATNATQLNGQASTAYALSAQEAFHNVGTAAEPPFTNGYVNFGGAFSTAGFMKDSLGFVHLKGTITGTSATSAFTLPAGYRPATSLFSPTPSNGPANTSGDLIITAAGTVTPSNNTGGIGNFGLDSITFKAG